MCTTFDKKAIRDGKVEKVEEWLAECEDINAFRALPADKPLEDVKAYFNKEDMTPLHFAVLYGQVEIMKLFLEEDAGITLCKVCI